MKQILLVIMTAVAAMLCAFDASAQQMPKNPIMFVTAIPNSADSATMCAVIGSHKGSFRACLRGGDLWIRYPNGALKNLTASAGYGSGGLQLQDAIAVRQPCVHWSGTKAVFSMLVSAIMSKNDHREVYWQLYEVSGLGPNDEVQINQVSGQPTANNISPIYGSDDRILFISDRKPECVDSAMTALDESLSMDVNTGVWSLDPRTGSSFQLDHAPSGDYNLSLDSYGRVVFSRWDILQQDQLPSVYAPRILTGFTGTEPAKNAQTNSCTPAAYPEENPFLLKISQTTHTQSGGGYFGDNSTVTITTTVASPAQQTGTEGTFFDPRLPSDFFPWSMNEDGSELQTLNHIGRHDLRDTIPASRTDDPAIFNFSAATSHRANHHALTNVLQLREDPLHPGQYIGVDAPVVGTHAAGQIVRLRNCAPSFSSHEVEVDYLNPRICRQTFADTAQVTSHPGFFRNPLPTSDGLLIAAHSANTGVDTKAFFPNPNSKYHFRLRVLRLQGDEYVPGEYLTPGISKGISFTNVENYYEPVIQWQGALWELDPVEVVAHPAPGKRVASISDIERQVFEEEGVDPERFSTYLREHKEALIVMRDLRQRDPDDHQQPFTLRCEQEKADTMKTRNTVYELTSLQLIEADYVGVHALSNGPVLPGRRVVPCLQHQVNNIFVKDTGLATWNNPSRVSICSDGSAAAFVPARRAVTWRTTSSADSDVVLERFWLSFAPGEIRTCARCHGENDKAEHFYLAPPTNKPLALRGLLRNWIIAQSPQRIVQTQPKKWSVQPQLPVVLRWGRDSLAKQYELSVRGVFQQQSVQILKTTVPGTDTSYALLSIAPAPENAIIQWEVRGIGEWGSSPSVTTSSFSLQAKTDVSSDQEAAMDVRLWPNPCTTFLQVELNSDESGSCLWSLRTCLGTTCKTSNGNTNISAGILQLSVADLASGVYVLEIERPTGLLRRHIVVQH